MEGILLRIAIVLALVTGAGQATALSPAARLEQIGPPALAATGAQGLAVALVEDGRVVAAKAWGSRNAAGAPLTLETVMYGASLTKPAFGLLVAQLAADGVIDLDRSIADYLPKPLSDHADAKGHADWGPLAGDERWRRLTPRILLAHGSGFANFGFLEPDGKLRFHFEPGARYAYSGDGYILLQFVLEQGLGLDVGPLMQQRIFGPLGMARTSMTWRQDFAGNIADGWTAQGKALPHDERSRVRAAGSMDTTIADMAKLAAALVSGRFPSRAAAREMVRPALPITTATQFPTLQPELAAAARRADLRSGLGLVLFEGPQGPGFLKGGNNEQTRNLMVCLARGRRCIVILGNDVRAEPRFPALVDALLGPTGAPWSWEYGPGIAP
jgi:CubicO group peptidase (beta-lactamase class C family)